MARRRDGRTVLLVDDDADLRAVTGMVLEHLGHRVIDAAGGEQALERLGEAGVDLVLLDVEMPRMDGPATLVRIRERWPELPVVLCTGFDRAHIHVGPGPTRFLHKPFSVPELAAVLNASLGPPRGAPPTD